MSKAKKKKFRYDGPAPFKKTDLKPETFVSRKHEMENIVIHKRLKIK